MITVVCADGRIRGGRFTDPELALQWAEWGHFCLGDHQFTTDDPIHDELPTSDDIERVALGEPVHL